MLWIIAGLLAALSVFLFFGNWLYHVNLVVAAVALIVAFLAFMRGRTGRRSGKP